MSDETFKDHLLDQLRQITDRLDRIEGALAEEPPAGPRNQRFWNEDDEPVGVRYEERPGVFKWKADFKKRFPKDEDFRNYIRKKYRWPKYSKYQRAKNGDE